MTQITTTLLFFDYTAHRFMEENCQDLGMSIVKGLSAEMKDLLSEKGRTELLEERDFIWVSLRDTGIGIEKVKSAAVFDSFVQADLSTRRTYGGAGLGLSICKGLIELMGGEIGVESELGKGSTFFFTVPCQQPRE